MRIALLGAFLLFICSVATAKQDPDEKELQAKVDSLEKSFTYQHGDITLGEGIGTISIPPGFKYLEPVQAERVLVDVWGNQRSEKMTMGLILPEKQGVLSDSGYVFNIQYDDMGYVKDEDAGKINYEELLDEMKKQSVEENKERTQQGFPAINMVGWAAKPHYDNERKILHWAKELNFAGADVNTLNYNVRILGRKGVLVLNAIATMNDLAAVNRDIPKVLDIVHFADGMQYKDYDGTTDKVAAWTIGGLVAGKVLAKVGFFALIIKFWKLIALGAVAIFGGLWKKFRKKKEEPYVLDQGNSTQIPDGHP